MRGLEYESRNIQWNAFIHDQSQVEMTIDYTLSEGSDCKKDGPNFEVEFYLYLPKSLSVTSKSAEASSLYQNIKNFIRVHTPELKSLHQVQLPFSEKYIQHGLAFGAKETLLFSVVKELKLFGNFINAQLKKCKQFQEMKDRVEEFQRIYSLILKFRKKYVEPLIRDQELVHEDILKAVTRVDEYCSIRFYILGVNNPDLFSGCKNIISQEFNYRKENFKSFDITNSSSEREYFYQRFSNLKKFVSEGVYLKSKSKNKNAVYKNVFAAIAAGLAALIANLAQVDRGISRGADDYGFKIFMLTLAVVVYIFKDRVKDLSKEYFNKRMKNTLPDIETTLEFEYISDEGKSKDHSVGKYQEFVKFLKEEDLPEEIKYLRKQSLNNKMHTPTGEDILSYKKKLWLKGNLASLFQLESSSFKDIFRFNITDYLSNMDDPTKSLNFLDDAEEIQTVEAPKRYYIDLLAKITANEGDKSKVELETIRLVLDKNGLIRIDELIPSGRYRFSGGELAAH